MNRFKSYKRNSTSYKRKQFHSLPSGNAFLIVTEGEKTEPNYLSTLRDRLHLSAAEVEVVHPEGTDPITLVRRAIELRNIRKREAKRGPLIEYDEVWVVYDLEKIHDERRGLDKKARNLSGASDIRFAVSDPCFEFWLLLHEEFTTRPFPDCADVVRQLKKSLTGYSKGQALLGDFIEKTPTAVIRSERCREHHRTSGDDGNPSTNMDLLIRVLNNATRHHRQFQFG